MNGTQNKSGENRRIPFNAVDIAIVLLILACIIGIYLRFERESQIATGEGEEYTVEFVCEKVRYTTGDYIRGDLQVFMTDGERKLGTLGQTVVKPSFEEKTVNGRKIIAHYPSDTLVDIYSSVTVKGIMTANGFLIGGDTYIAPNSILDISAKNVDMTVRVLSIRKVEAD